MKKMKCGIGQGHIAEEWWISEVVSTTGNRAGRLARCIDPSHANSRPNIPLYKDSKAHNA